ncbi:helix-turn-helix domain-containing protein [Streptomyces hypolithicus]
MPSITYHGVGARIAYERRIASLTQQRLADLAGMALGTLRKIERGERGVSGAILDSIAAALNIDTSRLLSGKDRPDDRVHQVMSTLSAAIATYDMPDDGPTRPLTELQNAVREAVNWRLRAQYVRIARQLPALLAELGRALHAAAPGQQAECARLFVATYRTADAVATSTGPTTCPPGSSTSRVSTARPPHNPKTRCSPPPSPMSAQKRSSRPRPTPRGSVPSSRPPTRRPASTTSPMTSGCTTRRTRTGRTSPSTRS